MPRPKEPAGYATNVFINCPFDTDYAPLFHAIVFAVIHCGYTVRCALEAEETGATRIDRIYRLIDECRFGVHDISRIEHDSINALPRFNMPFELGVFLLGAWCSRRSGTATKNICLISPGRTFGSTTMNRLRRWVPFAAGLQPHDPVSDTTPSFTKNTSVTGLFGS